MGYTRIIQSGDYLELYTYSKNKNDVSRHENHFKRKKRRPTRDYIAGDAVYFRSESSIRRAKANFFRLVATNLQGVERPAFVTLTLNKNFDVDVAYIVLRDFFKRLRKIKGKHVKYIAVPEWQPISGFLHFHCVVWGLAEKNETWESFERDRRNYQRQWLRGFVDLRVALDTSIKIAGYMAKYMAKASEDKRLYNIRAYSASGNIQRPNEAGSNALSDYLDILVADEKDLLTMREYDTMWLGRCNYQQYKIKRDTHGNSTT